MRLRTMTTGRYLVLGALLAALGAAPALEAGRLVSGPMLGHRAHREVTLWLETEGATSVGVDFWIEDRPETRRSITVAGPPTSPGGGQPLRIALPLLEMGARYAYALSIDGSPVALDRPLRFSTTAQWESRAPPPDFSFLLGSCAYVNDPPYDRPGRPYGHSTGIFQHMAASGADFMLWVGDNWYYREADFSSISGLWYRARHDRAVADLQPFLSAMHHYAIWDDHDYGSNDTNKSFEFKGPALEVFNAYWGNPSAGEPGHPGVYTKFFWSDAMFILLDNRWYRDDTRLVPGSGEPKRQLGRHQMDWLKQSLLQSKVLGQSTFTFVASGGQVLSELPTRSEGMVNYLDERAELLEFIRDNGIEGVVFLSGDVHFTELARLRLGDDRRVYELTSSPLLSGAWSDVLSIRPEDPNRIPGTVVNTQNYCQVSVGGPRNARTLVVRSYDSTNTLRWTHEIPAAELRRPKAPR